MCWLRAYLVTNRHVVKNEKKNWCPNLVKVRANPKDTGSASQFTLPLAIGNHYRWTAHPDNNVDVVVIPVDMTVVRARTDLSFFRSNQALTLDGLREAKIHEGASVYAFGFPLGLIGGERNFAIVRGGIIARVSDALSGHSSHFLIDVPIYEGNSGGPVTLEWGNRLIGIVRGYESHFGTNIQLAHVEPVGRINETIHHHASQAGL